MRKTKLRVVGGMSTCRADRLLGLPLYHISRHVASTFKRLATTTTHCDLNNFYHILLLGTFSFELWFESYLVFTVESLHFREITNRSPSSTSSPSSSVSLPDAPPPLRRPCATHPPPPRRSELCHVPSCALPATFLASRWPAPASPRRAATARAATSRRRPCSTTFPGAHHPPSRTAGPVGRVGPVFPRPNPRVTPRQFQI
jgi:hypothetical protein